MEAEIGIFLVHSPAFQLRSVDYAIGRGSAMTPNWYQFLHPWHWLTYGQNAAGLSSAIGAIGTGAAIAAGILVYQTYLTTSAQLGLAREEIILLKAQNMESMRPHLSMMVPPQQNSDRSALLVIVKNSGSGRALNIAGTGINIICTTLPPNGEVHAAIMVGTAKDRPGHGSGILQYSSADGRRFRTEVFVANWRTVIGENVEEIT